MNPVDDTQLDDSIAAVEGDVAPPSPVNPYTSRPIGRIPLGSSIGDPTPVRRIYGPAEMRARASELSAVRRRVEAQDQASARLEKKTRNAALEADFRTRGVKFYTDSFGDLQPEVDETGAQKFNVSTWRKSKDETGQWAWTRRNERGEVESRRPKLVAAKDLTDPNLYFDFGTQGREVAGHVDELARSEDAEVRKIATQRQAARASVIRRGSVKPLQDAHTAALVEMRTAGLKRRQLDDEIAKLQESLTGIEKSPDYSATQGGFAGIGANPTEKANWLRVQHGGILDRLTKLRKERDAVALSIDKDGALARKVEQARLEKEAWAHESKLGELSDLAERRRAFLRANKRSEEGDSVLGQITEQLRRFGTRLTQIAQTRETDDDARTAGQAQGDSAPLDDGQFRAEASAHQERLSGYLDRVESFKARVAAGEPLATLKPEASAIEHERRSLLGSESRLNQWGGRLVAERDRKAIETVGQLEKDRDSSPGDFFVANWAKLFSPEESQARTERMTKLRGEAAAGISDPSVSMLAKAERVLNYVGAVVSTPIDAIRGRTLADIAAQEKRDQAKQLIGDFRGANALKALRLQGEYADKLARGEPIVRVRGVETSDVLRQMGSADSLESLQALHDALRADDGTSPTVGALVGGREISRSVLQVASLINALPGVDVDFQAIGIDSKNPEQFAKHRALARAVAEMIDQKYHGSALAGMVAGSLNQFIAMNAVAQPAAARAAVAGKRTAAVENLGGVKTAAERGGLWLASAGVGASQSFYDNPDMTFAGRWVDILGNTIPLAVGEVAGNALERAATQAMPATLRGGRLAVGTAARVGGGTAGEVTSDVVQQLLSGQPFNGQVEDMLTGNAGAVLGMALLRGIGEAVPLRQARQYAGRLAALRAELSNRVGDVRSVVSTAKEPTEEGERARDILAMMPAGVVENFEQVVASLPMGPVERANDVGQLRGQNAQRLGRMLVAGTFAEQLQHRIADTGAALAQIHAVPDYVVADPATGQPVSTRAIAGANRDAARALVKIANGTKPALLTEAERQGLDVIGGDLGSEMVREVDGRAVLTDKARQWGGEMVPALGRLARRSESQELAERQMGAFLKQMPKAPGGRPKTSADTAEVSTPTTIREIGITHKQSSTAQKLAVVSTVESTPQPSQPTQAEEQEPAVIIDPELQQELAGQVVTDGQPVEATPASPQPAASQEPPTPTVAERPIKVVPAAVPTSAVIADPETPAPARVVNPPTEVERLRAQARELRELAARKVRSRANSKRAAELETRADALDREVPREPLAPPQSFKDTQRELLARIDEALQAAPSDEEFLEQAQKEGVKESVKGTFGSRQNKEARLRMQDWIKNRARELAAASSANPQVTIRSGNSAFTVPNTAETLARLRQLVERRISSRPAIPKGGTVQTTEREISNAPLSPESVEEGFKKAKSEAERRGWIDQMTDAQLDRLGLANQFVRVGPGQVIPRATAEKLQRRQGGGDTGPLDLEFSTPIAPEELQGTPSDDMAQIPQSDLSPADRVRAYLPLADRIAGTWDNIPGVDWQDVRQEARRSLVNAAREYDPGRGAFAPYASTLIRNRLRTVYRDSLRADRVEGISADATSDATGTSILDALVRDDFTGRDAAERNETRALVSDALEALPKRLRLVLNAVADGASYAEIAGRLDVSTSRAHELAGNGLRHLERELRRLGVRGFENGILASTQARLLKPESDPTAPRALEFTTPTNDPRSQEDAEEVRYFEDQINAQRGSGATPVRLTVRRLRDHVQSRQQSESDIASGSVRTHRALEAAFGKRIIFVEPSVPVAWQAVTAKRRSNTILVNTRSTNPFMALVGHELGHNIRNQAPDLFAAFAKVVAQVAPMPETYSAEKLAQGYDREAVSVEWVNDVLGARFDDPQFWREVARESDRRGADLGFDFGELVSRTIDWIASLGRRIRNLLHPQTAEPFIRDIRRLRRVAAEVLVEYQRRGPLPDDPLASGSADTELSTSSQSETEKVVGADKLPTTPVRLEVVRFDTGKPMMIELPAGRAETLLRNHLRSLRRLSECLSAGSSTLRDCIRKAGKLLSPANGEALLRAQRERVADGYPPLEAANASVEAAVEETQQQIASVYEQAGVEMPRDASLEMATTSDRPAAASATSTSPNPPGTLQSTNNQPPPTPPRKPAPVPDRPGQFFRSVPDSLRERGLTVARQVYERRSQDDAQAVAKEIIDAVGETRAAELSLNQEDRSVPEDVKTMVYGELLSRHAHRLSDPQSTKEDRARAQREIQRLQAVRPAQFTEHGQAISALQRVYANVHSATVAEYVGGVRAEQDRKLGEAGVTAIKETADRLEKAREQGIEEATKSLNRTLRKVPVTKGVWQKYREDAAGRMIDLLDKPATTPNERPPLQEFAQRVVAEMRSRLTAKLPSNQESTRSEPTAAEMLREAMDNREKYGEVFQTVRAAFVEKYGTGSPEVELIDTELANIGARPYSQRLLDLAIKEAHASMSLTVAELARQHFTRTDQQAAELADALVKFAGLTGENAKQVAADLEARAKDLVTEARRKALAKLRKSETSTPKTRAIHGVVAQVVEMGNIGALREPDLRDVVAKRLGLPYVAADEMQRLATLADRVETAANPASRARAELDLATALRDMHGVGPMEVATSIWYANLLSGFSTQAANAVGNLTNSVLQLATVAATNPGLTGEALRGWVGGFADGWTDARSILARGYGRRDLDAKVGGSGAALERIDYRRQFPNLLAKVAVGLNKHAALLRYVFRVMKAVDAVFYYSAKEAFTRVAVAKLLAGDYSGRELHEKTREVLQLPAHFIVNAKRRAEAEGYTDDLDFALRVADIIVEGRRKTEYGAKAEEAGERFALDVTFNNDPVGWAGVIFHHLAGLTDTFRPGGMPVLKAFLPFIRIPTNVFNTSLNFTPLGAVRAIRGMPEPKVRNGVVEVERREFTDDERMRLFVQSIGSTLAMASIYALASGTGDDDKEPWFTVTATGPSDFRKQEQLRATGWRQHSIKFGDVWIPYKDSPLLVPLAIVGNMVDARRYQKTNDDLTFNSRAVDSVMRGTRVLFDTSMLSGFGTLMDFLQDRASAERLTQFLTRIPADLLLPYSNLLRQIDRAFNPETRNPDGPLGTVGASIPFARNAGSARTDVLGESVKSSPLDRFASLETNEPLRQLLRDKNVFVPTPSRDSKLGDRPMTPQEYGEFVRIRGNLLNRQLSLRVPAMRPMPREQVERIVHRLAREATDDAKSYLRRSGAVEAKTK